MNDTPDCQDERRSRLLDAMPAIAWSAAAQTFRFNYVNPGGGDAPRLSRSHAGSTSRTSGPSIFIPRTATCRMLCHNETVAGRNHELVYRIIAADGRTVWLRDYVNVHKVDGMPVELFGVMVDITREREAEEASLADRENFRRMVELSPDCIGVHVDETYRLRQPGLRPTPRRNQRRGDRRPERLYSFVDPASHDSVRERLVQLRAGQSVPYIRQTFRRVDGSPLDVEVAALPLRYGNRDADQVIARDITEQVRAAAGSRRIGAALSRAGRRRHRNPLHRRPRRAVRFPQSQLRAKHRISNRGVDRPPVRGTIHAAFGVRRPSMTSSRRWPVTNESSTSTTSCAVGSGGHGRSVVAAALRRRRRDRHHRHGPRRHRAPQHRPQARRSEADEQPRTGGGLARA